MKIETLLGKDVQYSSHYDPKLLQPIPRNLGRGTAQLPGAAGQYPYHGEDIWNVYEVSWLSANGKPEVAIAEIRVPATSEFLIESKSLKLYFNSFNMTRIENAASLTAILEGDLGQAAGGKVNVTLTLANQFDGVQVAEPTGICLDELECNDFSYKVDPLLLTSDPGSASASETLFSRLFRSCCPVTGQPDWATVQVSYEGRKIERAGLLRYLVSYREHTGFHEACVELIFHHLMEQCRPDHLEVSARFTRRGGIDINPVRSTSASTSGGHWPNIRDPRQ